MSYSEQAEKINNDLKDVFSSMANQSESECGISADDVRKLINSILYFGQVAKFRCRSNSAYDNFASEVFKGIAELERSKLSNIDSLGMDAKESSFEVLQVKELI